MAARPDDLTQTDRWGWRPDGSGGIEVWAEVTPGQWDWGLAAGGATRYYESSVAVQPWVQTDADFGVSTAVTAYGFVTQINNYLANVTLTFESTVTVTTPGTGIPQFEINSVFRSLDAAFSGWAWGWSDPSSLRCSVHGQIGGLAFTGFVNRDGFILDANGDTLSRVIQTGDTLVGVVTGVFQND